MTDERTFIGQRGPWRLFAFRVTSEGREVGTLCGLHYADRWAFALAANSGARSERLSRPHHQTYLADRTPAEVCDLYTLLAESDDALSRFERDTLVSPQPTTKTDGEPHV